MEPHNTLCLLSPSGHSCSEFDYYSTGKCQRCGAVYSQEGMEAPVKYEIGPWYYADEAVAAQKKLDLNPEYSDWTVKVAAPCELQIDFDRKSEKQELPTRFKNCMKLLQQRFNVTEPLPYKMSKSKGMGTHITITLPAAMDDLEKVAWQAVMGSDRIREGLNILRIKRGIKNPILLFARKSEVEPTQTVRRIKDG